MKRNKHSLKKLTIIEILTIILILISILILMSPLFINMKDTSNKNKYIKDINIYIDRATKMYGNNKYKNKFIKDGNNYIIKFSNIDKVNINKDPYGFTYKKDESYLEFLTATKEVIVNVKSCINNEGVDYCYEVVNVNTKELGPDSIKTSIN